MISRLFATAAALALLSGVAHAQEHGNPPSTSEVTQPATNTGPLVINNKGYFAKRGLNVMVFSDYYPDGHQTGVTVIQHGVRVAANGDVRLEASPGQWSPMPTTDTPQGHVVDKANQTITQTLAYPDPTKNRTGFNPIDYPDLNFTYHVSVTPTADGGFKIDVDLDKPLPPEWVGKVGFNFELFPTPLFGKAWLMDGKTGLFPRQPDGPMATDGTTDITAPMAQGRTLIVDPEDDLQRMKIESRTGDLILLDGRGDRNNAWYVVRTLIPAGATTHAVEWIVSPNVVPNWTRDPVIQVSQVGYSPGQPKVAILESDPNDAAVDPISLYRLTPAGRELVKTAQPKAFGPWLRYDYRTFDFSDVTAPGMYELTYRDQVSHVFKIGEDVYDRDVWQPTIDYFLPNQMCHMLVKEKYRIWHGLDHMDDARMAQVGDHFDGYDQPAQNLTKYQPGDHVPDLNAGGWHDAGDYDLRIESQLGTVWTLSKLVTEFNLYYDATTIDQAEHVVEIHQPDGKNDIQQQIEHGLLSVLGGYEAMGRLYRGIQEAKLEQYPLLGDITNDTDNVVYQPGMKRDFTHGHNYGVDDDRWVFTEDNPDREEQSAGQLAAASVAIRDYNPKMSAEALAVAKDVYAKAKGREKHAGSRIPALAELYLATGDAAYLSELVSMKDQVVADIARSGWSVGQVIDKISDEGFRRDVTAAVAAYQAKVREESRDNPYGVPYKPDIWGAGWTIEEFGVHQYFFRKGWPQLTAAGSQQNALNFLLGVHPGENTAAFASGVGAISATTAYGNNRADWTYIPGGVVSGTALIRPDLPELKVWPYFWQQTEYVLGGGESHFTFLAVAAEKAAHAGADGGGTGKVAQ